MSSDFQRQLPGAQNASQNNGLYKVHLDPYLVGISLCCAWVRINDFVQCRRRANSFI
jgi:hypothetical protein